MASDVDFDKNRGLREVILDKVRRASQDLANCYHNDPQHSFDGNHKYAVLLSLCLEQCLLWGLKSSTFFVERSFYDFLRKGVDACGDSALRSSFDTANQLLLSKDGKMRAWIRLCLNQGTLADNLYTLAANRRFVTSWYDAWSIISTNALNDLHEITLAIQPLSFDFQLRDRNLDKSSIYEKGPELYRAINNLQPVTRNAETFKRKKRKKRKKKRQVEIIEKTNVLIEQSERDQLSALGEENKSQKEGESESMNDDENFETMEEIINHNMKHEAKLAEFEGEKQQREPQTEEQTEAESEKNIVETENFATQKKLTIIEESQNIRVGDSNTETEVMEKERLLKSDEQKENRSAATPPQAQETQNFISTYEQKKIATEVKGLPHPVGNINVKKPKISNIQAVRKRSNIQVMRTGGKPIYNKGRSNSKPFIPAIHADEMDFSSPESCNIVGKKKVQTPVEDEITYHFPESGQYKRDEEQFDQQFEENLLKEKNILPKLSSTIPEVNYNKSPDVNDIPVVQSFDYDSVEKETQILMSMEPEPADEGFFMPRPVRDRGLTTQAGLQNDFERRIFDSSRMISAISLQDGYFNENNEERDQRIEEQRFKRKRKLLAEQSLLRDQARSSQSSIANLRPSTGLILTALENLSVSECLQSQDNRCFSCDSSIGFGYCSRCCYTGQMYCNECMEEDEKFYIPRCLLFSLDFKKYTVSKAAFKHLNSMFKVPALPLSQINLKLAQRSTQLKNANKYLRQLSIAREYIYNSEITGLILQKFGDKVYLPDSYTSDRDSFPQPKGCVCCGLISMQDLIELLEGNFISELKRFILMVLESLKDVDAQMWDGLRRELEGR